MSSSDASCAICGFCENLLRCSRCKSVYYCSKEHQKKHWKKHRKDCEALTKKEESTVVTPPKAQEGADPETPPKTPSSQAPLTPSSSSLQSFSVSSASPGKSPGRSSKSSRSPDTFSERSLTSPQQELTPPRTPLPLEGSSEAEILSNSIENLCLSPNSAKAATQYAVRSPPHQAMALAGGNMPHRQFRSYADRNMPPYLHNTPSDDMVSVVIEDLNAYGLCVLDNFCGPQMGRAALQEVLNIYGRGIFQDGQLVAKSKNDAQSIRSDKIMWVDGREVFCKNIGQILNRIDTLIMKANKAKHNGRLGAYNINGRTKAMLAVYPGSGTHYVKHVDNPNHDGRCITAIYYLNINWDVQKSGGLLRIFPENKETTVADIAPTFDRLLFFWSDRQNPHEVQPAYDTRYAITLWYFDETERALATKRYSLEQQLKKLGNISGTPTVEQLEIMQQVQRGMQELKEQHERIQRRADRDLAEKKSHS